MLAESSMGPMTVIVQFEFSELILLLKFGKQFPVDRFEEQYLSQQYPPPPLDVSVHAVSPASEARRAEVRPSGLREPHGYRTTFVLIFMS